MTTMDEALEPVRRQVAMLPAHDDRVTVFGITLGDCRRLLAAAAADAGRLARDYARLKDARSDHADTR